MADNYRRKCRTCNEFILMLKCDDGQWRAFDFPEEEKTIGLCTTKEVLADVAIYLTRYVICSCP